MPERELIVTHSQKMVMVFLFILGICVSLLKRLRAGQMTNLWQVVAYILLGGFITAMVGGLLLWIFPNMPIYIMLALSGGLSTLLESKDIHHLIMSKMGIPDHDRKEGD